MVLVGVVPAPSCCHWRPVILLPRCQCPVATGSCRRPSSGCCPSAAKRAIQRQRPVRVGANLRGDVSWCDAATTCDATSTTPPPATAATLLLLLAVLRCGASRDAVSRRRKPAATAARGS